MTWLRSLRRDEMLRMTNEEIQHYISHNGTEIDTRLLKLLSDLDFIIRFGSPRRRRD
jgi:hypothetical protein